ncbi:dihydrolipoyllysine-residue acetyltransferase [Pseudohongiella sp.]|uniref:Dihydrolipoyllysine-residue acetyltransferase component of pyruvate dehydrogenase complex n=1 Tax=marine sediment metagenome TaxID=412755 RepID=A0A0F9Y0T0_9ZZZZ|nr:dihydrolipoyllysine-residue acetyltransferase [Pseudohongiella sp.]HDZ10392.1 dihydrolipoyllysine-residue acetyltransferase [Pseudohongiella sp.]HEA61985.1 dihydrolipoyllysine-residue acetyltransferase [Pseudohongiella sp.]
MPVESIKVPDLGDTKDVEVIEILVKVGDSVQENDSLLVLESDKAAMEIPSPRSGVIKKIIVKVGDEVNKDDEIFSMEVEGDAKAESASDKGADKDADKKQAEKPAADAKAQKQEQEPESEPEEDKPASKSVELIRVPDIGGDSDVEVIEIHVKEGDEVKAEDTLITLESDKAAMDVPSPASGIVKSLKLKVGDKVSKDSPVLEMEVVSSGSSAKTSDNKKSTGTSEKFEAAGSTESAPETDPSASAKLDDKRLAKKQAEFAETAATRSDSKVYAGPAVRKLARELGVDLTLVDGSGSKGRVQKEDVQKFVKSRLQGPATAGAAGGAGIPAIPDVDFSQFGEIEERPMSKLHKVTAANMHRNWLNVPAVAQFNEADVTGLEEFRNAQRKESEKRGVKLTPLPFMLKACAKVLDEYKQFNVSLHSSGEVLIQKKYIHIGVAVATEAGLVVPVIRNVDQKSIWQLAAELTEMTDKAKNRRLSKEDMQGACFTISSLGAIGGTSFTPIVNAPEVGILGISKTQVKPVYINNEFVPRQMLPFVLCYDHRAVNGVDAGLFATRLAEILSDIRLLMM